MLEVSSLPGEEREITGNQHLRQTHERPRWEEKSPAAAGESLSMNFSGGR